MLAAVGVQLDKLLEAYRGGGGVSWGQLGDNARDSQAALNRPWFESRLARLHSHRSHRSMPFFRNQPSELQISDAVLAGRRSRLPAVSISNGARSRYR